MTSGRLGLRDVRATFWMAAMATLFVLIRAGVDVPGLHSERVLAGSVLLLGMLGCGAGTRPDAFAGPATPAVLMLRLLGVATLLVGVVAVILGTTAFTNVFFGCVLALWIGATLRHALTDELPSVEASVPRVKELV